MEKIQIFLEGKKTFLGIALMGASMLNLAPFISNGEITVVLEALFSIGGVALAVYGRMVVK